MMADCASPRAHSHAHPHGSTARQGRGGEGAGPETGPAKPGAFAPIFGERYLCTPFFFEFWAWGNCTQTPPSGVITTAPKPVLNEVRVFDLLRTRRNVFHLKSYFLLRSKHYLGFKNLSVDIILGEVAVCPEIRTKHLNTRCEQNIEYLNVKPGGNYSKHKL